MIDLQRVDFFLETMLTKLFPTALIAPQSRWADTTVDATAYNFQTVIHADLTALSR